MCETFMLPHLPECGFVFCASAKCVHVKIIMNISLAGSNSLLLPCNYQIIVSSESLEVNIATLPSGTNEAGFVNDHNCMLLLCCAECEDFLFVV